MKDLLCKYKVDFDMLRYFFNWLASNSREEQTTSVEYMLYKIIFDDLKLQLNV